MDIKPYRIALEPLRRLMTITFDQTFWSVQVAEQFRADCLGGVAALNCAAGTHLILVDLHNAVIQSQDVYDRMKTLAGSATAARIALVASTPLARMQTKRLQIRDTIVMFADVAEAKMWLFDSDLEEAAA